MFFLLGTHASNVSHLDMTIALATGSQCSSVAVLDRFVAPGRVVAGYTRYRRNPWCDSRTVYLYTFAAVRRA